MTGAGSNSANASTRTPLGEAWRPSVGRVARSGDHCWQHLGQAQTQSGISFKAGFEAIPRWRARANSPRRNSVYRGPTSNSRLFQAVSHRTKDVDSSGQETGHIIDRSGRSVGRPATTLGRAGGSFECAWLATAFSPAELAPRIEIRCKPPHSKLTARTFLSVVWRRLLPSAAGVIRLRRRSAGR
jgi:hypothetical protein